MKRTTAILLACAAAGALWLGIDAALRAISPVALAGRWLRAAWRMTTRTAPEGPAVLERVQRLGRLETCRYNEQVVVRGDTSGILPVWVAGDRLVFLGRGEVVAGVDLARLHPEDVRVDGDAVRIRLPPSEILHARLDNVQSEVMDRQTGLFTGPDRQLETRV